jgi:membrane protease YdiL (CAAX protease family)
MIADFHRRFALISNNTPHMTQSQFLTSAGIFEGLVLFAAFVGGWLTGVNPTAKLFWSLPDFCLGVLATGPMLILLTICVVSRSKGIVQVREFLRDSIGPLLNECRWFDIVLLALIAGICEEIFFRGFLFLWIQERNPVLAVMVTNLLFGLAHAVTPVYAMLAAFLGLYLTALIAADPTPNLLIPITAHSLYDLIAFIVVIRDYRNHPEHG